jgi:hypothetical protein
MSIVTLQVMPTEVEMKIERLLHGWRKGGLRALYRPKWLSIADLWTFIPRLPHTTKSEQVERIVRELGLSQTPISAVTGECTT